MSLIKGLFGTALVLAANLAVASAVSAGVPDGECIMQRTTDESGKIVWVRLCL